MLKMHWKYIGIITIDRIYLVHYHDFSQKQIMILSLQSPVKFGLLKDQLNL